MKTITYLLKSGEKYTLTTSHQNHLEFIRDFFESISITLKDNELVDDFIYDKVNRKWEKSIKNKLSGTLYMNNHIIACIRCAGYLKDKSFYLSSAFNWEIIKDENEEYCLVPTKK